MVPIPSGLRASIELGGKERYYTTIRGGEEENYIIIDPPVKSGQPLPLQSDEPCILRFVFEGEVMGFATTVLSVIHRPVRLVFLRYPARVERKTLRKEPRYSTRITCSYTTDAGKAEGVILDLSRHGCALQTTESFENGNILYLTFVLPNQAPVEDQLAEVRNVAPRNENFVLGLLFPQPNEFIEEFISLFSPEE